MRLISTLLPLTALCLAPAIHARPASPVAFALADPARSPASTALDEGRRPAEVLTFAAIRPGATVVDWMAGQGYYTELLADVVGKSGHVLAVEAKEFYKPDSWIKLTAVHPNVELLVQPIGAQSLAPASADVIFSHLTFHDLFLGTERGTPLPAAQSVLAMWRAALKPGGTVIIADHAGPAGDTGEIARKLHRIATASAKAELAQAGFVLVAESTVLHRSDDKPDMLVFDPAVRGHTNRFLLKLRRK